MDTRAKTKLLLSEHIVLLHGILRTERHMQTLADKLASTGYAVHNLGYPSTKSELKPLAEALAFQIQERTQYAEKVHFIGYSMGGLLARIILAHYRPQNLGRVVQLAPPNNGSEVADFLQKNFLFRKLFGPAGQQLITNQSAIKDLFGIVDYELGILAGTRCIDPFSALLLASPHDGKVTVESTKLEGMRDHMVIAASHTFFPQHKEAHHQTLYFLKNGKFEQ